MLGIFTCRFRYSFKSIISQTVSFPAAPFTPPSIHEKSHQYVSQMEYSLGTGYRMVLSTCTQAEKEGTDVAEIDRASGPVLEPPAVGLGEAVRHGSQSHRRAEEPECLGLILTQLLTC